MAYQVDLYMCGQDFTGDVRDVAAYLTDHGYPATAVTDSVNGANNDMTEEPPQTVWLAALAHAERLEANRD